MIGSKGKLWDMKIRKGLLELMEVLVRLGKTDVAKEVGKTSQLYAHRINNHDYKKEDEEWAIVLELDRKSKEIGQI